MIQIETIYKRELNNLNTGIFTVPIEYLDFYRLFRFFNNGSDDVFVISKIMDPSKAFYAVCFENQTYWIPYDKIKPRAQFEHYYITFKLEQAYTDIEAFIVENQSFADIEARFKQYWSGKAGNMGKRVQSYIPLMYSILDRVARKKMNQDMIQRCYEMIA